MSFRQLHSVIESVAASDGAGVKLRRSLGRSQHLRFDPFLMLDEFVSDDPDDYLAGFPAHPHRGFGTVTYMLDGHVRHEDSLGNRGDLGPGDVQWMTAARGIVHSEMPQQSEGRIRGFQLWINLPAREKMKPAAYRDIPSDEIPTAALPQRAAGLLTAGDAVRIRAGEAGVKLLLLASRPIGEPVVQYGPFVMNTAAEIQQAIADYQSGRLGREGDGRARVANSTIAAV